MEYGLFFIVVSLMAISWRIADGVAELRQLRKLKEHELHVKADELPD